jgi:hypothetical protein
MEISADVTPNGLEGTTAIAQTTNLSSGKLTRRMVVTFLPVASDPNLFLLNLPYDKDLTGPWTVTFTNNASTANTMTVTTPSIEGVKPAPTPISVTKTGTRLNPTFSRSYPAVVGGVQLLVYDKSATIYGTNVLNVFSIDIPGDELIYCANCPGRRFHCDLGFFLRRGSQGVGSAESCRRR